MSDPNLMDKIVGDSFVVIASDLQQDFFCASDRPKFDRLRLHEDPDNSEYIGVLCRSGEVVALSEFNIHIRPGHQIDIKFLEVAESFFGNQYGLQLLRETFKYAEQSCPVNSNDRVCVSISEFTPEGRKFIEPHIDEITQEYPNVDFICSS